MSPSNVTKLTLTLMLVLATLASACAPRPAQPNPNQPQPIPTASSAEEREGAYRRDVAAVLAPHYAGQQTAGITQRLLALTVPARFQDLHLQLVLVFSRFDTAWANGDADAAEEAAA